MKISFKSEEKKDFLIQTKTEFTDSRSGINVNVKGKFFRQKDYE